MPRVVNHQPQSPTMTWALRSVLSSASLSLPSTSLAFALVLASTLRCHRCETRCPPEKRGKCVCVLNGEFLGHQIFRKVVFETTFSDMVIKQWIQFLDVIFHTAAPQWAPCLPTDFLVSWTIVPTTFSPRLSIWSVWGSVSQWSSCLFMFFPMIVMMEWCTFFNKPSQI